MAWLRRRRTATPPPSTELVLSPKVERALVALAVHASQLDGRIDRLEQRLADAVEAQHVLPSHDDVVEVRVHSAKVAAELARVTVELKAEIEHATALASRPAELRLTPEQQRVITLAEQIADFSDALDGDAPQPWADTA